MQNRTYNFKALWWLLVIPAALLVGTMVHGCGGTAPDAKNRVPTVQAQLDQAQQAAHDAKAAADQAAQAQKNIQDAITKLDSNGRNSDGSVKIGHPEISGVGTVTEVGETDTKSGETTTHVFWFTFSERGGFVKKFEKVCPNQAVPVNSAVILNFHWHPYEDSSDPGCYQIDGYTVVK